MELEFSAVGDSVEHNGGKSQEEARQALHRGAEVRRSAAPSDRQDPVSELCEQHGLQPTVFYRRGKDHFENGVAALERRLVLSLAKMQDSI